MFVNKSKYYQGLDLGLGSGISVVMIEGRGECETENIMLSSVRIKEVTGGSHPKRFSVTTNNFSSSSPSSFFIYIYIPHHSYCVAPLSPNFLGSFSLPFFSQTKHLLFAFDSEVVDIS